MTSIPDARFSRFERVIVSGESHSPQFTGRHGTVIWRDFFSKAGRSTWLYVVHFSDENQCRTIRESALTSAGAFDSPELHLGRRPEVSFDLVMEPDVPVIEGSYRRPRAFWEVMIFSRRDVAECRWEKQIWHSGITGMFFEVPDSARLDRDYVIAALSTATGCSGWVEVQGPDSIDLR